MIRTEKLLDQAEEFIRAKRQTEPYAAHLVEELVNRIIYLARGKKEK